MADTSDISCGSCGGKIAENAKFCARCGKSVISANLQCESCKHPIKAEDKFCSHCGKKVLFESNNSKLEDLAKAPDAALHQPSVQTNDSQYVDDQITKHATEASKADNNIDNDHNDDNKDDDKDDNKDDDKDGDKDDDKDDNKDDNKVNDKDDDKEEEEEEEEEIFLEATGGSSDQNLAGNDIVTKQKSIKIKK